MDFQRSDTNLPKKRDPGFEKDLSLRKGREKSSQSALSIKLKAMFITNAKTTQEKLFSTEGPLFREQSGEKTSSRERCLMDQSGKKNKGNRVKKRDLTHPR